MTEKEREKVQVELAAEFDLWRASPLGALHHRLLVKWREEMLDRWGSDSLGDSKADEQIRGQVIFVTNYLKMDGEDFVEELFKSEVI